jgi:hypothetical protein
MGIRNCLRICEVFVSRLRRLNAFCMRTHTSGFANARLQCGLTCGRAAGAWSIRPNTSLAWIHIFRGNMKKAQRLKMTSGAKAQIFKIALHGPKGPLFHRNFPGLKPKVLRSLYAALKGRSSTALYAANSLRSPLPEGKGWGRSSTVGVR